LLLPFRFPALATSGTPAWTIILVAVLTGLFGVASGAGMAAFLTVRHETAERLRDRMIKAADDFVVAVIQAFGSLNRLERIAGQAASELSSSQESGGSSSDSEEEEIPGLDELAANVMQDLDSVGTASSRLYVVFPTPTVADLADKLYFALGGWLKASVSILEGEIPDVQPTDLERRAVTLLGEPMTPLNIVGARAMRARDAVLREMNEQIRKGMV
jgi:hypothetical protein